MKKAVLFFVALLICTFMQAQGNTPKMRIDFSVYFNAGVIITKPIHNPTPKSPEDPPLVYQEENVLYFDGDHPGYALTLKDEDGDTVYTTTVNSTDTVVTLPSTLSGDYEIELVYGNWQFLGWITL